MGYLDGFAVTFKKLFKRSDTGRILTVDFPKEKTVKRIKSNKMKEPDR